MHPEPSNEVLTVPRSAIQLPLIVPKPARFKAAEPATWPDLPGRLEYVGRRLLFMPPCGALQQGVALSVSGILDEWAAQHVEFFPGGNEAGMLLGGEVRGADAAVWRRADLPARLGTGFVRAAPVLAVEVAGDDESEATLSAKARWYLARGVAHVWLVLPEAREVVVLTESGRKRRYKSGDRLPPTSDLPGLSPSVDRFFRHVR